MSQIGWWAKESITIAFILCHSIYRKLKIKAGKALFGDWGQIVTASGMPLCEVKPDTCHGFWHEKQLKPEGLECSWRLERGGSIYRKLELSWIDWCASETISKTLAWNNKNCRKWLPWQGYGRIHWEEMWKTSCNEEIFHVLLGYGYFVHLLNCTLWMCTFCCR